MNYLLISHGSYAQATLDSCQMITGPLANVRAVAFKQTMNQKDLLAEMEKAVASFKAKDQLTLICDVKGGTPSNTALLYKNEHPQTQILTGLSLGLLLPLATGTPVAQALKQARINTNYFNLNGKSNAKNELGYDPNAKLTPHTIHNVRIDSRLIHGQVATMWVNKIGANRLMVVGDDIVKSSIQKTALKTATPAGIHLSILTVKGAARRINSGKYEGQTVFLIVRDPHVLTELSQLNVRLPEINVGNLSSKAGSKQVAKSVAVTKADIKDFNYLNAHGSHLYHQMVPADEAEDFMKMIK